MHSMSTEDGIACMIEISNQWLAVNLFVCIPHVGAAKDTTDSHDGHEVTCQSCRASRTAHHDPELRKHRNSTNEETTHPRDITNHLIVHVSTKQMRRCGRHGKPSSKMCPGSNSSRISSA